MKNAHLWDTQTPSHQLPAPVSEFLQILLVGHGIQWWHLSSRLFTRVVQMQAGFRGAQGCRLLVWEGQQKRRTLLSRSAAFTGRKREKMGQKLARGVWERQGGVQTGVALPQWPHEPVSWRRKVFLWLDFPNVEVLEKCLWFFRRKIKQKFNNNGAQPWDSSCRISSQEPWPGATARVYGFQISEFFKKLFCVILCT